MFQLKPCFSWSSCKCTQVCLIDTVYLTSTACDAELNLVVITVHLLQITTYLYSRNIHLVIFTIYFLYESIMCFTNHQNSLPLSSPNFTLRTLSIIIFTESNSECCSHKVTLSTHREDLNWQSLFLLCPSYWHLRRLWHVHRVVEQGIQNGA